MLKLIIWAPFRGNIGTVEAVKNYAKIFSEIGYEVVFIELCDEWSGVNEIKDFYEIRSLSVSKILKSIGKSNIFRRRDYFTYQFFRIRKLSKCFNEEKPDLIISFLGIVPAIIANYTVKSSHFGSVQGFPKFLNAEAPKNFYYKIEDYFRKYAWKITYNRLDKLLCMTPKTAQMLGNFLRKDTLFVPNPLFRENDNLEVKFDQTKTIDFIFIGRNSYQKRLDILLLNFTAILAFKTDSKLHFFGDVSASELILEFPDYEIIIRKSCIFYGFSKTFWTVILDNLNPLHLISSQWEDPGHAILEGLWKKVPTVFLNSKGDYIDFYSRYGVVLIEDSNFSEEILNNIISRSADEELRVYLKNELASQFTISKVKLKLRKLCHV